MRKKTETSFKLTLEHLLDRIRERPVAAGIVVVAFVVALAGAVRLAAPSATFSVEESTETSFEEPSEQFVEPSDTKKQAEEQPQVDEKKTLFVHVSGCVAVPGLYELVADARVADAISAAGGVTDQAAPGGVNLARVVSDGEQIVVPSVEQVESGFPQQNATASVGGASAAQSKVNINTADASALDTVPGIGPSTAEKIIADREENGPFSSIEDLKRVSGIGDKKFEDMRDSICV